MNPWGIPETNTRRTLELRDVIAGGVDLWAFDYPSYYKDDAKKAFEQKVIDHYLYRQIGAETVGRFLHYFRTTVREIMPYYIQRYESVDLMKDPEIRPLDNYNMIEEMEGETSGNKSETVGSTTTGSGSSTGKTTGSGSSTGKTTVAGTSKTNTTGSGNGEKTIESADKATNVHSDTPQGTLNLSVGLTDTVETLSHASDTTQDVKKGETSETSTASETSETTGTSSDETNTTGSTTENTETTGSTTESTETNGTTTGTESGTNKHRLTRRGNIGVTTYAQLLEGYRQTFLNIDMEIINELETCFLGVY